MPKVKTTTFKHTNSAGEALEFKSDISVDSEGVFSATVPDDVATALRTLSLHGNEVWTTCPRQNWRVTGRDLEKVMRAVDAGMEELLAVETTVERVIVYSHKIDLGAWENSDGSLHANGGIGGEGYDAGARWHPMGSHLHANSLTSHFQVGLYAEVLDMVTHRRPNSQRVEFRSPEWEHSHLDHPTWASKLNGFPCLKRSDRPEALPRLPYTEENARFFYEMLIALCYLGHNLHDFFSDQGNVVKAIKRGAVPMLVNRAEPVEAE